jgi:hypothetical protein
VPRVRRSRDSDQLERIDGPAVRQRQIDRRHERRGGGCRVRRERGAGFSRQRPGVEHADLDIVDHDSIARREARNAVALKRPGAFIQHDRAAADLLEKVHAVDAADDGLVARDVGLRQDPVIVRIPADPKLRVAEHTAHARAHRRRVHTDDFKRHCHQPVPHADPAAS